MAVEISTLPSLIRRMLEADFYPHPTQPEVRLVQTHISYVLLTGQYVYKIKKTVKLSFLDFSTLERRRHFCLEELRLNRRGAPELYLDVVAITTEGNEFHLNGVGEVVEYAVKMQQFQQESLFNNLLAKGKLEVEQIRELAKILADYHSMATEPDVRDGFGRPERVRKAIDENFDITAKYIGELQTQRQFEETKAYTDKFVTDDFDLLNERLERHRIRECHGDLHLGNICLWEGKIRLFDCIEFNESLRFIDVMNDAAFVAMDLDAAERMDRATQFINSYAEWTGDWEGLQVFPLYCCMRAYVRAMVYSLASDETELSLQEREQARQSARRYYQLAWQYTLGSEGRLMLISGVSGAGKSTIAANLARKTGAIHIRSDAVRKHLGKVQLDERAEQNLYSPEMNARTYAKLLDLGVLLGRRGFRVILDAKYDRRDIRKHAVARAREAGLPISLIHCVASEDVLRARLNARRGDVSDARADLLTEQVSTFEPFDVDEQAFLKVAHTALPIDENDLCDWWKHRTQADAGER